jgi:hypothetical protein
MATEFQWRQKQFQIVVRDNVWTKFLFSCYPFTGIKKCIFKYILFKFEQI